MQQPCSGQLEYQGVKRSSIALASLMLVSLLSAFVPTASATDIVLTDAVQVVDSGTHNDRMIALNADSEGNIHVVWSRNTNHLYYKMLDPRGETLIEQTQISDPGQQRAWHPDVKVDDNDMVHIVWTDKAGQYKIMYTLLDPSLDDQNGDASLDSVLSVLPDDYEVTNNPQNRDWPAIDVDSNNNPHIVWEDHFEPLEKFYQQPQIYYKMLSIDHIARTAIIEVDDTLLTPILGHKGHPDIAVDVDDFVQIVWDDTRGGKVEMAVPIDTSGSMNTEWADMCVVFYGGNFASGGFFPGLKPLLVSANMTVYETLYALSGNWPSAATSGACADAYQTGGSGSQGPRNLPLGITPGDDSGGIRELTQVVYNNQAVDLPADGGYYSEFWGPASTWACLSWRDISGNVPGNPPTSADHPWNPNATKIIIPISDEGPYGGTPMDNDDTQSINQAHDACVIADIIPTPLWAGSDTGVGSYMQDLAQCPNGAGLNTRTCPGSTTRLTNAGGQMYSFPTTSSSSTELEIMVEAMVYLATNNSREIYMTVLDPLSLLENPWPGWVPGDSGTEMNSQYGYYSEDLGPSEDEQGYGHLVVVNDTRITIDDAYSLHPAISIDSSGNTHLVWQDGRVYGFEIDVNYEVYYTKLRLRGSAAWNGAPGGLPTFGIKLIADGAISDVEGPAGIPADRPFAANSHFPAIITDSFDNVHIAWLDNYNETQGETVMYTRLNHTNDAYPDGFPLNSIASAIFDPWQKVPVTLWQSDKLGPNSPASPDYGMPPAFANDLGSGAHLGWSDTNKCNEDHNSNRYTLCYVHVLTGLVDVSLACDDKVQGNPNLLGYPYDCPIDAETFYHTIQPGDLTTFNMTIANPTPGPAELVKDTFTVTVDGVPNNWTATLFFATNNTPVFDSTPVFLEGGEVVPLYIRIRAPTIYQAKQDELAQITILATSHKDPAIRNQQLLLTLMDVVHGIELDTSHSQVDVEQGKSAVFSITIKNTGNVYDTFAFYDPSTLEGQNEWALPFGWGIDFPTSLSLDPGQSTTKNLKVSVPESQDPGTFVIYLKGWSTGEPVLSIDRGTFDVLELWINVSIRTTGNIVFQIGDTKQYVLPGECAYFAIEVTKHFTPGHIVFTTPGAPEEKPESFDLLTWQFNHWTVDLDFSEAPGGNSIPDKAPRYWAQIDTPYTVTAEMCAPYNSTAGIGESITVRAHLDGSPKVRDSVVILTNVVQRYELEAAIPNTILELYPGQSYQMDTTIENLGNGPDRYDVSIASIVDASGGSHVWDMNIPRILFQELDRDESQTVPILVNVPEQTLAGQYTITFNVLSEEPFEGTRLQDNLVLRITIVEFHDMRISLDPAVESKIKTTAPSRIVRFTVNVTNHGNIPDQPTLHNHTVDVAGVWGVSPGMYALSTWRIDFALLEGFRTEYPREKPCVEIIVGEAPPEGECFVTPGLTVTLPMMEPYTTFQVVVIVTIAPDAALQDRFIGIKTKSMFGSSEVGGDHDETPIWDDSCTLDANKDGLPDNYPPACDTNEQILELRLRAPDLEIIEVEAAKTKGEIGEMLSVSVKVVNRGNAHATDVNIILCKDQSETDIKRNGCEETNIVYRQIVKAIMPIAEDDTEEPNSITLLYMVQAGNHDIVVVVDPDNVIVETDETNNIRRIPGGKMSSTLGVVDVGVDVIAKYSVPVIILGATFSLIGVSGYVIYGRRIAALSRFAELSSLLPGMEDDDLRF
ncbi:uncharacterized protein METZ01_LOCUS35202 [marine metagenome]|uniref:CARDB domain-containing protein n=1 Tax=marine metagenome TaxID=408172 RepID=A0A381QUN1_9ZZZZ